MIILWHFTWFHYTSRLTLLPSDLLVARCGGSGAPPSFCLYFKFHNIIVELIKHTFTWAQVLITFAPRDLDSWARLFLDFVLLQASWSFCELLGAFWSLSELQWAIVGFSKLLLACFLLAVCLYSLPGVRALLKSTTQTYTKATNFPFDTLNPWNSGLYLKLNSITF